MMTGHSLSYQVGYKNAVEDSANWLFERLSRVVEVYDGDITDRIMKEDLINEYRNNFVK